MSAHERSWKPRERSVSAHERSRESAHERSWALLSAHDERSWAVVSKIAHEKSEKSGHERSRALMSSLALMWVLTTHERSWALMVILGFILTAYTSDGQLQLCLYCICWYCSNCCISYVWCISVQYSPYYAPLYYTDPPLKLRRFLERKFVIANDPRPIEKLVYFDQKHRCKQHLFAQHLYLTSMDA